MAHAPESMSYQGPVSQSEAVPADQSTKQLDFYQAMSDFKLMFPNMDEEIIEAVLRANNGGVDGTIDQLLTMNIDNDETSTRPDVVTDFNSALPPSYDEAVANMMQDEKKHGLPPDLIAGTKNSPSTTHAPPVPKKQDVDLLSSDLQTFQFSLAAASSEASSLPPPVTKSKHFHKHSTSLDLPVPPRLSRPERHTSLGSHDRVRSSAQNQHQTFIKRPYKKWNPPLLGTLPDDFLRLVPVKKSSSSRRHSAGVTRHHSLHVNSTKDNEIHSTVFIQGRSPSPNAMSDSPPKLPPRNRPASQSAEKKGSTLLRRTQSELNSEIIKKKMAENLQKRTSISGADIDPAIIQELEDEHYALMMQNKEFLEMLKKDKDFMKTLERDRMNATAFDFGPEPSEPQEDSAPSASGGQSVGPFHVDESALSQGYGDDRSQEIGAFPFTKDMPAAGADGGDAEFKRQLKNMGQSSKNKFQALAKKFFKSRRRRTPKQVLGETNAPSTLNLLDDFDDDDERDLDEEVKESRPEFEPLPGVPYYRTVQRPPYKPDGVTTYHGNEDMV